MQKLAAKTVFHREIGNFTNGTLEAISGPIYRCHLKMANHLIIAYINRCIFAFIGIQTTPPVAGIGVYTAYRNVY